jgi:hypothetical protein
VRTSDRLRLIRIVAGVLVVLGFGVAVVLTLNSSKNNNSPPLGTNILTPPTSAPNGEVGPSGHVKVPPGMYAVAVPYELLPGVPITSCSYVDIIQLDAGHNQVATFSHILVLRQANGGANGKAAMIVEATPANLEPLVVAANQPYGVQVSLDGQDTSGDCTA